MLGYVAAGVVAVTAAARVVPSPTPTVAARAGDETVRFGRDIRPILSDRCFLCHGPDGGDRKADLRLDTREGAMAGRKSGAAIVPGDPDASLLMKRVQSADADELMPPPESGKHALTAAERELLRAWIAQGATYETHWSFVQPAAPTVPQPRDERDWCRTDIDRFVLNALHAAQLEPSPDAPRAVLARRVFLDLTGLPPTPEEIRAFESDPRPDAYEALVDTLLTVEPYKSRHAERMTVAWLDLARYADTSGIHMDAGRQMWAWRDWVLAAYRDNMPYDRFVIEQIAGDLLPNATQAQKIATGFHRNHVTSDEGGGIDAEYLLEYAIDRTNTTGAVFLGLNVGCARCHDHKFDPITAADYFGLLAFFNSNEEPGIYSQVPDANRPLEPYIEVPTPEQQGLISKLDAELRARSKERASPVAEDSAALASFVDGLHAQGAIGWRVATPVSAVSMNGAALVAQPDGSVLASGPNPPSDVHVVTVRVAAAPSAPTADRLILLEFLADASLPGGRAGRAANGNAALSGVQVEAVSAVDPSKRAPVELTWAWADVEQSNGDFRAVNTLSADPSRSWAADCHNAAGGRVLLLCAAQPFSFEGGTDLVVRLRYESEHTHHAFGRVRVNTAAISPALLAQLPEASGSWNITGPFAADNGAQAYATTYGPESATSIAASARFAKQPWRYAPGVLENTPVNLAQGIGAEFVAREIWSPDERDLSLSLGSDDGLVVYVNGAKVHEHQIDRGVAPDQERAVIRLKPGRNTLVCKVVNTGGPGGFFHRAERDASCMPRETVALVLPESSATPERTARGTEAWRSAFSPAYRALTERIQEIEKARTAALANVTKTMVMQDRATPMETFVLTRGQYDKPDRERPVQRAVPAVLGALPDDAPRTRLGLAQWLMSDGNPLTARVTANRLWEMLFGRGIVRSSDDFGLQGDWPTNLELLDWLALDLRSNGWDIQRTLRSIVLSSVYRQESRVRPDAVAADAENALLAYFPRQRLAAEQVRDQALYASGLLVETLGGPSVKPYQPEGLWQEVAMPQSNTRTFVQGKGEDLWRRSLYTYWKRAAPPPSMLALDAPTREFCTTRRLTTNTPLQALVLWNDPQFVEAARALAARVLRAKDASAANATPNATAIARPAGAVLPNTALDRSHLQEMFALCTGTAPSPALEAQMLGALAAFRARYAAAPDDAAKLIAVGDSPAPEGIPPPELAAWTLIANAVLSSDATIVKD